MQEVLREKNGIITSHNGKNVANNDEEKGFATAT